MRSTTVRTWLIALAVLVSGTLAFTPAVASAAFGLSSFSTSESTAQAGAHADLTTAFDLNTDALGNPIGQLRDATITLPPGLIGNPNAVERCSIASFEGLSCGRGSQVGVLGFALLPCEGISAPLTAEAEAGATTLHVGDAESFCSEERDGEAGGTIMIGTGPSAEEAQVASVANDTTIELEAPLAHPQPVGEAVTHVAKATQMTVPLYNVEPAPGHVATFAASLLLEDVYVQVNVKPDGRLTATIAESSTQLEIQGATITLWGVPAANVHNPERCSEFLDECGASPDEAAAFLTNPTSCSESPEEEVIATSWQGESATSSAQLPSLTGCEQLSMAPSLAVAPSTTRQDSPAGYEVALHVPQNETPYGLATPALERVSVTLPPGTSLSPGLANGLQACEPAQFGEDRCPNASRIGTAEVITPLLPETLKGALYIGTPTPTERYRVFLRVNAGNTVISLQGKVETNEETGQVTTAFQDLPELPFATLRLNFFGGATAALANPETCGPATSGGSAASFAGQMVNLSSTFEINEAAEGGACQSALPFTPSFTAGTTDPLAGHTSSFILAVSRTDGQQSLSSFTAHLPPGLVGLVGRVPLCREPAAGEGTCPQASEVGAATITAGAGPLPLVVSGPVYLTGPYDGAPFGLDMRINAIAGPFDLGTSLVRSRILLNPSNMALTIASDTLPQTLGGIPLRVRAVDVSLDRSGFIVNPTNCAHQVFSATINSSQGDAVALSTPFDVVGCAGLVFKPRLTASTHAMASQQGDGASLDINVSSPTGEGASIRSVTTQMPAQLRPRLTTIQHACVAAHLSSLTSCPAESQVGDATVTSPATHSPLAGPIYLVSHGSNTLPALVMLLQSEGIEVKLEGTLNVSPKGVISATFNDLPDVPVSSFDLRLSRGPYSLLGAITNLCGKQLGLAYSVVGQNGTKIKRFVRIAVIGCQRHKLPRTTRSSIASHVGIAVDLTEADAHTLIDQRGAQVTGSTDVAVGGCREPVIKRAEILDRSERHCRDDARSAHA